MRELRLPIPVKLFIGMLSADPVLIESCVNLLREEYGPVDYQSESVPWIGSDFYQEELGPGLLRSFVFFERLWDPGELSAIKLNTIRIENEFAVHAGAEARRRINLDPGYLTEAKVVLATTKDYFHRLYIGKGIHAEVTLRYSADNRGFVPLEYTYLDYRSEPYRSMFNKARDLLRTALQRPART